MFHRSIDVPLLNTRESQSRTWKRIWYASAVFFGSISVTLAVAYGMTLYRYKRSTLCAQQLAILSGLDLIWLYIAFVFFHSSFQHHKIRMLVGEILGICMIPLYGFGIDALDRCSSLANSDPLYAWIIGWIACASMLIIVAFVIWMYTLGKWCFCPQGLRVTWRDTNEEHSDHRSSSVSNALSSEDTKSQDNEENV